MCFTTSRHVSLTSIDILPSAVEDRVIEISE